MDVSEAQKNLKKFTESVNCKVWAISAVEGTGLKELIEQIYKEIENVKKEAEEDNDKDWDESPYGEE